MREVYVGNLLYTVTLEEVRALFAAYGPVYSVKLMAEREPVRPHAYAFVELPDENAQAAVRMLDGTEFLGRTLRVEEALPEKSLSR